MTSALDEFERQLIDASHRLSHPTLDSRLRPTPLRGHRDAPSRRRVPRLPRRPLAIVLATAIIAGGGVAAASSILWPAQRLADGRVNCFMATHGTGALDGKTLAVAGAKPDGQPPISLCRMWYRLNHYRLNGSRTGAEVAALPLIACRENSTTVGVYVATGHPNQCQSLGEKPLPMAYASAATHLRDLQRALLALQRKRECAPPALIAAGARAILSSQGFSGWRVITPPAHDPEKRWIFGYPLPAGTGGTCGTLLTGSYPPSNIVDIDAQRQTITVSLGPPRSVAYTVNRVMGRLVEATSRRCYTRTTIRPIARRLFAHTALVPRFATIAGPRGVMYAPPLAERLWEHGCVRGFLAIPGNDNRFVDILLNARTAPRLGTGQVYPPATWFRP